MNPIKNIWGILDWNLRKKKIKPSTKPELLALLHQTWQEIPQDDIRQLINAMPRRVLALKNSKGNVNQIIVIKFVSINFWFCSTY